jgi:hypothetical protein
LWAVVTVSLKYQIGWMAIGVGALVGYAVRILGKGVTTTFGGIGGAFALLGCLLGNLLSTCGFLAAQESVPFLQVAGASIMHPSLALELLTATFSSMDLVFYGIAVYEGYKFSFRQLTADDVAQPAPK